MDQLINSLPALLRAAGNAEEVTEAAALAVWKRVAGEGLALQTLPLSLREKRLSVAVSDSVWQRQLEALSGQLLFRLNALLGAGTVRFIEFFVDPDAIQIRWNQKRRGTEAAEASNVPSPIPFELISAAATIHDPDLRRSFLGAASVAVRRRESRRNPDSSS
jgi:hypothetical protein